MNILTIYCVTSMSTLVNSSLTVWQFTWLVSDAQCCNVTNSVSTALLFFEDLGLALPEYVQ